METSSAAAKISPGGSIAVTGPAAENGVYFAGIAVDGHSFSGRNGLGLVMAEKKLKYLQVKGSGKTSVHDREMLMQAREEIFRLVSASPILKGDMGISELGTGTLFDLINSRRMLPVNNFRATYLENSQSLNAWQYKQKYKTRKTGCAGCHILCKKKSEKNLKMPEYETMSHFSALLGNNDMETVVAANKLCDELGMDTISAASTLACYAEIAGRKLDASGILSLLQDIAWSRNEGEKLKLGSCLYSRLKVKPGSSVSVKGMELPAYDPRGAYGMALAYATSNRGGCHLRAYPISHEILRKPVATDRFSFSGKARIIKLNEDLNAVVDSLTACKFIFFAASLEEYAKALCGVTGRKTTAQDLLKTGERIYYHERIMNAMNGFSRKEDILPERFFTEEGSSGEGIRINPINREEFYETLANYYMIRGLDEDGRPKPEKCRELGLEWKSW